MDKKNKKQNSCQKGMILTVSILISLWIEILSLPQIISIIMITVKMDYIDWIPIFQAFVKAEL